jgi:hypothetical protein
MVFDTLASNGVWERGVSDIGLVYDGAPGDMIACKVGWLNVITSFVANINLVRRVSRRPFVQKELDHNGTRGYGRAKLNIR